jgi:hypothetical protein
VVRLIILDHLTELPVPVQILLSAQSLPQVVEVAAQLVMQDLQVVRAVVQHKTRLAVQHLP